MRLPAFWFGPPGRPGLTARLLSPLGWLFAAVAARWPGRETVLDVDVPVIRVGSFMLGAPDSTPVVIALVLHLQALGLRVFVVSVGSGGRSADPVEVDPRVDDVSEVGDDPLLMAAFTRVWTGADAGVVTRMAAAAGAEVIILHGTQGQVRGPRTLSVTVVEAHRGFGNGLCLPAGPLRAPIAAGLARADLLLCIGPSEAQAAFDGCWGQLLALPRLRGHLAPPETGMDWSGTPFLAFAGTDHPERFFATLRGLGATLIRAEALEAHQPLTPMLMARLEAEAARHGAQLVTTERDAVRLPADFRGKVLSLPLRLQITDHAPLDSVLERVSPH